MHLQKTQNKMDSNSQLTFSEPSATPAPSLTKRKRDLIQKFEMMYQKLGGMSTIENPFATISPDEEVSEIWKKVGNNKMLGVLHAFVLLRPIIKDAVECDENAEGEEAKLLSEVATKVDYLNSVVHEVVKRSSDSQN